MQVFGPAKMPAQGGHSGHGGWRKLAVALAQAGLLQQRTEGADFGLAGGLTGRAIVARALFTTRTILLAALRTGLLAAAGVAVRAALTVRRCS